LAAAIGALGLIIAAIIGARYHSNSSNSGTTTQAPTTPVTATQGALPIRFDPVTGTVPRCASFTGKGDVPQGRQLWIVVVTNEGGRAKYYFDDASAASGQWSAPKVSIGSISDPAGEWFKVWAVTFTNATSQNISSGRYQNGTSHLFADASVQDRIAVQLGRNHRPC
jgi:hypothetical protein